MRTISVDVRNCAWLCVIGWWLHDATLLSCIHYFPLFFCCSGVLCEGDNQYERIFGNGIKDPADGDGKNNKPVIVVE